MGDSETTEGLATEATIALTVGNNCNSEKTRLKYAVSDPRHEAVVCSWYPTSKIACAVLLLKPTAIPLNEMLFESFLEAARLIWECELVPPNPVVDESIQFTKRFLDAPATGGVGSSATGGEWHRNLVAASVNAKLGIVSAGVETFDFEAGSTPAQRNIAWKPVRDFMQGVEEQPEWFMKWAAQKKAGGQRETQKT